MCKYTSCRCHNEERREANRNDAAIDALMRGAHVPTALLGEQVRQAFVNHVNNFSATYGSGKLQPGTYEVPGFAPDTLIVPTSNEEVILDLDNPIQSAINQLLDILTSKGGDYAESGDEFSNFRTTAEHMQLEIWEVAEMFMVTKLARLKALRQGDGEPNHESIEDTYMDLAGYAILAFAMYQEENV